MAVGPLLLFIDLEFPPQASWIWLDSLLALSASKHDQLDVSVTEHANSKVQFQFIHLVQRFHRAMKNPSLPYSEGNMVNV